MKTKKIPFVKTVKLHTANRYSMSIGYRIRQYLPLILMLGGLSILIGTAMSVFVTDCPNKASNTVKVK